ncbi:BREX-2 system adenine-specific DNA-methyltransferase PglX [Frankia sp. R82]|uniref:BREX-2 system adenine-specific DNA-methyltransferase PglX n=1 Tax=Frankia sp. R82 TaxID=2950553 RepID=UPI0020443F6D|nr:BREX-2 system adenine-specific DNA-methyltransferase PglX [Frankia sp. R82]MCM3886262.1 BREX-2 system adenine-specific DNA-methyltransferase PglX [Frankia sp. R82]
MIDRVALLKDAQRQVKDLEKDLRAQVDEVTEVGTRLRAEYDRAFKVGRTAATWSAWLGERVTQAAVAWVLGTVFVRFCEDNGLIGDPYLAGPTTARLTLAEERTEDFYTRHPEKTARDWLLASFDEIAKVSVGAALFDRRHNALFQIPPTHDAAKNLLAFWRRRTESGTLIHDFTDATWDTRFLGDLYQDLSEDVRKKYALLQTPEFVEEFILDLTLTPAIDEFGYDVVKLIDPTCGSGHFLLGAFRRLLAEWEKNAPDRDVFERVQLALDAVHGVDVNPYASAIAKFRLTIEALRVAGVTVLDSAAGYTFPLHVATGDSLIKYRQPDLFGDARDELAEFTYATEDLAAHPGILDEGRYHAVVGNPPYIQVADKKISKAYRDRYAYCHREYALTIPFFERLFKLARPDGAAGGGGFVGQITANSFMKREFGTKLVRDFLPEITLNRVIDVSLAHIPHHGTPTVIILGRRQWPSKGGVVRSVLGILGEPSIPTDPSKGLVWSAIKKQYDHPGSVSPWVSCADVPIGRYFRHPWSLSGGGAADLAEWLNIGRPPLAKIIDTAGRMVTTGDDSAYVVRRTATLGSEVSLSCAVEGSFVRDWGLVEPVWILTPYSAKWELHAAHNLGMILHLLWPLRTPLSLRKRFGVPLRDLGRPWYEWRELYHSKMNGTSTIAYPRVATHNHFFLERAGIPIKDTAPVLKLPINASEGEHLGLLGVLNSSTACFWLKQVSHDKGSQGVNEGVKSQAWERFYEFTGTKLRDFPLPAEYPLDLARELDGLAQGLTAVSPVSVAADEVPTRGRLAAAQVEWESVRARMIALQEELDWQVYRQYGLLADELTLPMDDVPEIRLGERAFEVVLARKIAAGEEASEWFARHGSTPITELPEHWPAEYRALVEKRISVMETDRNIGLIERPEYKRRWATEGWDKLQDAALRDWLLDRLEARELWFADVDDMVQPRLWTTGRLADELAGDADFVAVAEIYRPGENLARVVRDLVENEHVPFLSALRYKDSGLVKRADWELVWDRQRAEDAAADPEASKAIRDSIPVPPKYAPADFRKPSYWRARGKLDVPKERFISYQPAGPDNDPTLLIGWAGWDHREQAQALATLIVERQDNDGWNAERLTPLLAGLHEVMPWVRQWHNEVDPMYDGSPAEVYDAFLADVMGRNNLTADALTGWRPAPAARGRKAAQK